MLNTSFAAPFFCGFTSKEQGPWVTFNMCMANSDRDAIVSKKKLYTPPPPPTQKPANDADADAVTSPTNELHQSQSPQQDIKSMFESTRKRALADESQADQEKETKLLKMQPQAKVKTEPPDSPNRTQMDDSQHSVHTTLTECVERLMDEAQPQGAHCGPDEASKENVAATAGASPVDTSAASVALPLPLPPSESESLEKPPQSVHPPQVNINAEKFENAEKSFEPGAEYDVALKKCPEAAPGPEHKPAEHNETETSHPLWEPTHQPARKNHESDAVQQSSPSGGHHGDPFQLHDMGAGKCARVDSTTSTASLNGSMATQNSETEMNNNNKGESCAAATQATQPQAIDRKTVKSLQEVYRFWDDSIHELDVEERGGGLDCLLGNWSDDSLSTAFSGSLFAGLCL